MKIPFADIAKTGSRYFIDDAAWLAETGLRSSGPVQAEVVLRRKGETRVEAEGFLRAGVRLVCDRCLTEYDFPVAAAFHLILESAAEENWKVREMECTTADMDVVRLDEPAADLADMLRQQLCLSLPVKQLCSETCRGLCPHCGIDLNSNECACLFQKENSPFAVLTALKTDR